MKQTAVDWYFDKIKSHFEHDGDLYEVACMTYAIAKLKEKEQTENLYTEEQVREAIEMAYMFGQAGHFVGEGESCTNEIIQSLKQPKQ